jgi:hypothetical protein
MGLDDKLLFTAEWAIAITFGITMILLFRSLIFN